MTMSLEPPPTPVSSLPAAPVLENSPSAAVAAPADLIADEAPVVELPLVPIVLGLIGHRVIPPEHRQAISGRFRAIFEQIKAADPRTPLVLLTGLAEGADQLAAVVALETGVAVRAVLPFAPEVYRQSTSFSDDDARAGFDLLISDDRVDRYVAPLPPEFAPAGVDWPRVDWSRVATDRQDLSFMDVRHACYANVGCYIVRRCHALLAVWDGRDGDPDHPSGTAEQVRFKLSGTVPRLYPWADAEPLGFRGERGLVLAIHSPKQAASDESAKAKVGELTILMPGHRHGGPGSVEWTSAPASWNRLLGRRVQPLSRFWARVRDSLGLKPTRKSREQAELTQFREICQSVRDFNRDISREQTAESIRKLLIENTEQHDIPVFDKLERRWYRRFSQVREAADEVSQRLRVPLDRMHKSLFALIALSAAFFHFYAHGFKVVVDGKIGYTAHATGWLWAFSVCIVLAVLVVIVDWLTRIDQRRLDARALGEGLRVRRVWAKSGISRSVADSYAGQLRGEFSWVRHALLHICPPTRFWAEQFERLPVTEQKRLLEEVRDEWIVGKEGQIAYLAGAHKRAHKSATALRPRGFMIAIIGWLMAILLLCVPAEVPHVEAPAPADKVAAPKLEAPAEEPHHPSGPAHPSHEIIIASSLLVIFGGLMIAFSERQGHEELARQFERMEVLFRNADRELADRLARNDIKGARRVIEQLGLEAITEQTGWYMLRRARSLELHIG